MKFAEMKDLVTERLVLRRMCFDDLYNYYERICSDGNVTRYMKFEPHQDIRRASSSMTARPGFWPGWRMAVCVTV